MILVAQSESNKPRDGEQIRPANEAPLAAGPGPRQTTESARVAMRRLSGATVRTSGRLDRMAATLARPCARMTA